MKADIPNLLHSSNLRDGLLDQPCALALLTSVSPLFATFLLVKVSGVPLLEAKSDKRYGGRPEYEAYKRRTGRVLPKFLLRAKGD